MFENFLVCFIITSHMLRDDVTIKQKMSREYSDVLVSVIAP